jgi:phosphatidylserine/phosphatidylglycerophosphate/cardiolipin synthase-like enzyme
MKITRASLLILWFALVAGYATAFTEVLFSPEDKPTKRLLECINSAQRRIHAAVYMLTDKVIAQALIQAHTKRHVDVQIIIDKITYDSMFGKGKLLQENGLSIFVYEPPKASSANRPFFNGPIMHHKFALFDNTLWTGSFNWTVAANRYNQENVIITDNNEARTRFEGCFERLKTTCVTRIKPEHSSKVERSPFDKLAQVWRDFLIRRVDA